MVSIESVGLKERLGKRCEQGVRYLVKIDLIKVLFTLITYTAESSRAQKVLGNQGVLRQPIVRNVKQATVGYAPDEWKTWQ